MRRLLMLLALAPLLWSAEDLKSLLEAADRNDLVAAYEAQYRAAESSREAARSSYLPRIDLGANAVLLDKTGTIDVRESYTAYAKAGFTLFDGFRRENLLEELAAKSRSSRAELSGFRKELALQVTQTYFELLNLRGDIDAQRQQRRQLTEQLERQERFLAARIATEEEVERIRAAVANADYRIASLRYQAESLASQLQTLTGIEVSEPLPGSFIPPEPGETTEPDAIRAMRYDAEALDASAKQRTASYYPTLAVEDTYSYYEYDGASTAFPIERLDRQNRLVVNLSMNLIDFSAGSREKEAVMAQKLALEHRIAHEAKRSDANVRLALKAIERALSMVAAAEQALSASAKTLETVSRKYRARLVDYVTYLDALTQHTDATAQFNRAGNTLQGAYAQYYFDAGYDPKEFLR